MDSPKRVWKGMATMGSRLKFGDVVWQHPSERCSGCGQAKVKVYSQPWVMETGWLAHLARPQGRWAEPALRGACLQSAAAPAPGRVYQLCLQTHLLLQPELYENSGRRPRRGVPVHTALLKAPHQLHSGCWLCSVDTVRPQKTRARQRPTRIARCTQPIQVEAPARRASMLHNNARPNAAILKHTSAGAAGDCAVRSLDHLSRSATTRLALVNSLSTHGPGTCHAFVCCTLLAILG